MTPERMFDIMDRYFMDDLFRYSELAMITVNGLHAGVMRMQLESERLLLRRFKSSDWKNLYDYLSLDEVVRFEPYPPFTEEQCREEAVGRSRLDYFWAVCLKESNKVIGNVYFQKQEPDEFMTWELGYVFNPSFGGRGYATESCLRILEYGFGELKARRIVAMCNPENTPSWKLLERLKMRREGHLIKNIFFKRDAMGKPQWNDTYEYALLADEWLSFAEKTRMKGV